MEEWILNGNKIIIFLKHFLATTGIDFWLQKLFSSYKSENKKCKILKKIVF